MLKHIHSVVLFVPDIAAAARWYAEVFGADVKWENAQFAFIEGPGVRIGFHPSDHKCPAGPGGTTVYWEVNDVAQTIELLTERGARLHRGPGSTALGDAIAMLIDPFGCTIGLLAPAPSVTANVPA